jgi:hypothetical protein
MAPLPGRAVRRKVVYYNVQENEMSSEWRAMGLSGVHLTLNNAHRARLSMTR